MNGPRSIDAERDQALHLVLLGVRVSIHAAGRGLLDRYAMVFERFVREPGDSPAEIAFRIAPDGEGVSVAVEQDGALDEHRLPDEDRLFGFVYARILDQVTRRDPALICVHAAALERDGRAIAIAADSGHGKSTLTLSLAARGWGFLSDEVAAIERGTLRVRPFPMALGCRGGTARLLHGTEFGEHGFTPRGWAGKTFFCPPGGRPASEARLDALFFLEARPPSARRPRRYRMGLEPWDTAAARRLSEIEGILDVSLDAAGGAVEVEVAPGAWVAPRVEGLLRDEGVMVAAVDEVGTPPPDFAAEPTLKRLRTVEGVLGVLRHLRGFGTLVELSASAPEGFGGLVATLAERMRGVRFYRLTPGRLPALVEAIDAASREAHA